VIIPSPPRRFLAAVTLGASAVGVAAAFYHARSGITLSHYDARGHLVVARRIVDSLTPGWQQIGAVWLPLPHLVNAIPVQVDALYRTGAFAILVSIAAFAAATAAVAWIVATITRSLAAALVAAAVLALNPNILYLQATPMTEPLLLGLTLVAVALLIAWCADGDPKRVAPQTRTVGIDPERVAPQTRTVGIAFALACMTRYEAWPVTMFALVAAAWARYRLHKRWRAALREVAVIAAYPAAAIVGFTIFSRIVVGQWFASGFFVPENEALGRPLAAANQVFLGVRTLGGTILTVVALVGLIGLVLRGLTSQTEARVIVAVAPLAAAALPWLAFVQGHPHRIRYMVPLLAAQAIGVGAAAGRWGGAAPVAALVLALVGAYELAPSYGAAPMIVEAQWDQPNAVARRHVTSCLQQNYDGTTIMASMGSLGHYMQELASAGFGIRDFLHEGNGDIWLAAIDQARPFAGWILIEEYAEGGDMLAARARENPWLLESFSRVCAGGGVALYRRREIEN
jgi:hypothetical protein